MRQEFVKTLNEIAAVLFLQILGVNELHWHQHDAKRPIPLNLWPHYIPAISISFML
jgi:hypothetical protein